MKYIRNSWIINRPAHLARAEGVFHAEVHRWTSAASENVSHILKVSFFSLKIQSPHTLQLQLHSTTCLDWLDSQAGVDTRHCPRSVRGQSAYTVCRNCTRTVRIHCLPKLYAEYLRTLYAGVDEALNSIFWHQSSTISVEQTPIY